MPLITSVCTGGLRRRRHTLAGRPAATRWGYPDLLDEFATIEVRPDARFVNDANVIICAGLSAGIDVALHLVARIVGMHRARKVRRAIQYDRQPQSEDRQDDRLHDRIPGTSPRPPTHVSLGQDDAHGSLAPRHSRGEVASVLDERDRGDDSQRLVPNTRVVASGGPAAVSWDSWSGHSELTGEADVQPPEELPVMAS